MEEIGSNGNLTPSSLYNVLSVGIWLNYFKMTNTENAHGANMSFTTIRNTKVAPEDIPRYPLTGGKCVIVVPNSHDPRPGFTDGQYNTSLHRTPTIGAGEFNVMKAKQLSKLW
jgi:hypothetical protein